MDTRISLALSCLALLGLGCMDPSVFQSFGATPPPPPRRGESLTTRPPPLAQPGPPPGDPFWGMPRKGEIIGQSPENVAIIIDKVDTNTLNQVGVGIGFAARGGNVRVRAAGGPLMARNGLHIGVAGDDFRARLDAVARHGRSSSSERMFITVLSGQEGVILCGDDVFVQRLGFWTPQGFAVLVERAFVGRSLAVRPRILGNGAVEVELWPRFTTRRGKAINLTELTTKVAVRDGQSIVVGGMSSGGTDVGSVLFGFGSRERTGSMSMILTVKIGGLPLEWPRGNW